VDNPKKIAINYLTGWFFIDLVATVPISLFLPSDDSSSTTPTPAS
jgi:hypothetical protein